MIKHRLPRLMTLSRARTLLALVQAATGPDRSIDFTVFTLTSPDEEVSHWSPNERNFYTRSLDDLFEMVDRVLPKWSPGVGSNIDRFRASLVEPSPFRPHPSISRGRPSRALALLEAFLVEVVRIREFEKADKEAVQAVAAEDSLPAVVKRARLASGRFATEIAASVGISQTAMSALERGSSTYGAEQVLRELGVDPATVLCPSLRGRPLRSRGAWRGGRNFSG